jgi:putative copper resistance protein D
VAALVLLHFAALPVLAHGAAPEPRSTADVLLAWSFEAHVWLPLLAAGWLYWAGVRRVARNHPTNPVPRWRPWCWYAGLAVLLVALSSPIAAYDTTLFSVHMVQHLLLTLVAAPLLALGAPITLLLRVSSAPIRRRVILRLLHSLPMRVLSFPVVTWLLFAGVMWASHFSPLFDAALESEAAHVFEHALYLGVGMLFWWPVVGADPSPWRLPHAARLAYLFLGMPQSSFLGLAILSAPSVLYPHYLTLARDWGPTALEDQQLAGAIMWAGGDALFLTGLILALWVWLRAEEAAGRRADARLDRQQARDQREQARDQREQARDQREQARDRVRTVHEKSVR